MAWTTEELVYLAAYLEGEGSFLVTSKLSTTGEQYPVFTICANSTDEDVLHRVWKIAGVGTFNGPTIPKNPKHSPYWRWGVNKRDDCYRLALAIWPYMGERRGNQISKLVAAYDCSGRAKWRHGTRQGYDFRKCRCGLCRASNAQRGREQRAMRKLKANMIQQEEDARAGL